MLAGDIHWVGLSVIQDEDTKDIEAEFTLLVKHAEKKIYFNSYQNTFGNQNTQDTENLSNFLMPMVDVIELPDKK